MTDEAPTPELAHLAEAYGIATQYWSFFGEQVTVPASTLRAVLAAMHVDATTDAAVGAALHEVDERPWRALLPPSFVTRPGARTLPVTVADAHDVRLTVALEDGGARELPIPEQRPAARTVDGALYWRVEVPIPADFPLGWHTVQATQVPFGGGAPDRTASAPLVVTPERLPAPRPGPDAAGDSWRSCTRCARGPRGAWATSPTSATSPPSREPAGPISCS
ncbi:hypothetical protein [Microbacterium sp.]|uniref:hypothetical protein n=1 Tax=Microbacterium sp. TaxID=51671 RepID=UPI0039E5DEB0